MTNQRNVDAYRSDTAATKRAIEPVTPDATVPSETLKTRNPPRRGCWGDIDGTVGWLLGHEVQVDGRLSSSGLRRFLGYLKWRSTRLEFETLSK
jgi:hypothetical protein